ncbi:MAG: IS5 family transposase [Steroidobacteraceae bacterium]
MPVYPAAAQNATCSCEGCLCRDRVPCYPSDLTDAQWSVLEPLAVETMRELVLARGRPMVHDLRATLDAVSYVTRNGIEWRAMPVDFPPWSSVYAFYERWNCRELPQGLTGRLRARLRAHQGRQEEPTGCIIDSQIVKCADTVGAATSGYHGGKKIKGRGRHLIVDTEGWPLALAVTAASISDKAGARLVTARLLLLFTTLAIMWADTGYNGSPLHDWMREKAGITLEIVARASPHTFQLLKRRWVVERTFGWLMRYRRLARDYERRPEHHEAMVWWATVFIMTKRLTRYETGQPPEVRWGGERTRPAQQAAL